MANDILKKLSESGLDEDSGFLEAMEKVETAEEAAKVLREFGVSATAEEFLAFGKTMMPSEDGELSENDLEDVAGGGKGYDNYCYGYWTAMGCTGSSKKDLKGFHQKAGYAVGKVMGKITGKW